MRRILAAPVAGVAGFAAAERAFFADAWFRAYDKWMAGPHGRNFTKAWIDLAMTPYPTSRLLRRLP